MASFPTREECVLTELLRAHAERTPEKVFAIFEDGEEWTYAETAARTWRVYPLRDYGRGWDEPTM